MNKAPFSGTKADWQNPFVVAMIVYYLLMAIVGMWVPDSILKDNAWTREFSDFMAGIVPQIDRITVLGIKPDVNRFYFSMLWAGSPIPFGLCILLNWDGRRRNHPMWVMPFFKALIPFALAIILVFWSQNLWGVDSSKRLSIILFSSDLCRGFFGQVVFFTGVIIFISGHAVWLFGWLTGYIPRNIQRQRNG